MPDADPHSHHHHSLSDFGSGICQKYQGTACSQFLNNRSIYVRNEHYQNVMEQKILQAFTVIVTSPDISVQCNRYAISSLCYYVFPLCDDEVVVSSVVTGSSASMSSSSAAVAANPALMMMMPQQSPPPPPVAPPPTPRKVGSQSSADLFVFIPVSKKPFHFSRFAAMSANSSSRTSAGWSTPSRRSTT